MFAFGDLSESSPSEPSAVMILIAILPLGLPLLAVGGGGLHIQDTISNPNTKNILEKYEYVLYIFAFGDLAECSDSER